MVSLLRPLGRQNAEHRGAANLQPAAISALRMSKPYLNRHWERSVFRSFSTGPLAWPQFMVLGQSEALYFRKGSATQNLLRLRTGPGSRRNSTASTPPEA